MDSPIAAAGSPPPKDSPFSQYVSNLSPIEPLKSRSSTCRDLIFPSPDLVFSSPHVQRPRNLDISRRCKNSFFPSSEKSCSNCAYSAMSCTRRVVHNGTCASASASQLIFGIPNDGESDCQSEDQPCSGASTSGDLYLVDPLESCDNSAVSPQVSLKKEAEEPRGRQDDSSSRQKPNTVVTKFKGSGEDPSCTHVTLQSGQDHGVSLGSRKLSGCSKKIDSAICLSNTTNCKTRKNSNSRSSLCKVEKCPPGKKLSLVVYEAQNEDEKLEMADELKIDEHGKQLKASRKQRTENKASRKQRTENKASRKQRTVNKYQSKSRLNQKNAAEAKLQFISPDVHCIDASHANPEVISCGKLVPQSVTAKSSQKIDMTSQTEEPSQNPFIENSEEEHPKVLSCDLDDQLVYLKHLHLSPLSKLIDYRSPPNLKRPLSEGANQSEDATPVNIKKKRWKACDDDSEKYCCCKRSKCLKLYCDCFGSAKFCSAACSCKDCSNMPGNKEAVLEARQLIESRNPIAFAPKVVLFGAQPNEGSKGMTPPSSRHIRGCSCKKTRCLKRYCECFQAGVGCFAGCRCEGCENTFGRKCGRSKIMDIERVKPLETNQDIQIPDRHLVRARVKMEAKTFCCDSPFSPLAPAIEASNCGKEKPMPNLAALPLARYHESSRSSPAASFDENKFEKSKQLSLVVYDPHDPYQISQQKDSISPSTCTAITKVKLFEGSDCISIDSTCWHTSPITPLAGSAERKMVTGSDSDVGVHCHWDLGV